MRPSLRYSLIAALTVFSFMASACDASVDPVEIEPGPLPDITVNDCTGSSVDLKAWAAQYDVVYITLAAKWCSACAKEVSEINDTIIPAFDGQKVAVAQVLVESDPETKPPQILCEQWTTSTEPDFPIFVDVDWSAVDALVGGNVGGRLPLHLIVKGDEILVSSYTETIGSIKTLLTAFSK